MSRSNLTLTQDFLDLHFQLEGGTQIGGLLRHEGTIGVAVRSPEFRPYMRDLRDLLARLRAEAGVSIRLVSDPAQARLHIQSVPLRDLQRAEPGAACFIVPGVTSWDEFRSRGKGGRVRWSRQRTLGQIAIFIPTDTQAQDVRACLNEEIAQALGPANDLYRLPDSVFNDDNRHTILTPFDMLMLRVLYHPDLRSGMSRNLVASRVPGILNRLNPQGQGIGTLARAPDSRAWDDQIATALSRSNTPSRRLRAAERAVSIARRMSPNDHRLSVALITRGRLQRDRNPGAALGDFRAAYGLNARLFGQQDLRTAQAAFQVALELFLMGRAEEALVLIDRAKPVATRMQDAVLLSSLLAVEAQALTELGDAAAARRARLDHLRWARYAYGEADGARARAQAGLEAEAAAGTRASH